MSDLEIVYKSVNDIIPYSNNSRTHSDDQVKQIAASIKEFNFTNPILIDENNGIIAGHGRLMAASKLSMQQVPCIVLKGLSEAQRKAYVIADNKLALNSGWDNDLLRVELERLAELDFDLMLTGFSQDELDVVINHADLNFGAGSEEDQGHLDELSPKIVKCPMCDCEFDSRVK